MSIVENVYLLRSCMSLVWYGFREKPLFILLLDSSWTTGTSPVAARTSCRVASCSCSCISFLPFFFRVSAGPNRWIFLLGPRRTWARVKNCWQNWFLPTWESIIFVRFLPPAIVGPRGFPPYKPRLSRLVWIAPFWFPGTIPYLRSAQTTNDERIDPY